MSDYQAILIGAGSEFTRQSGKIVVRSYSVLFSGEDKSHEISFPNLTISIGGNNKELVFFSDKRNPDISFYTSDRTILKEASIKEHPDFSSQIKVIRKTRRNIGISLISVIAFFTSLIIGLFFCKDYFVEKLANKLPIEWEQKLGDKLFQTLTLQYDFVENDTLKNELKRVAAPLIKQIEKDGTKIEFYFIKDATINAFALPGGKVVIQTGLIEHAKSWEELLGVVSHELAHVTRRHHIRGIINNLGLYVIISSLLGDVTAISGTIANMGGDLASLANSRSFETEADETGLNYLTASNIDPAGLISFFKTLQAESSVKEEGYLSFISTHPATEDRIEHLNKLIKQKKINFNPISDDFNKYKQIINN